MDPRFCGDDGIAKVILSTQECLIFQYKVIEFVMLLYSDSYNIYNHIVRLVVAEKDIEMEVVFVDADNKPEDLIHLNPYNSLPTLVDRELVLYGSKVITDYLDERYPHPPFLPIDPVSRAKTRLTLYRIEQDWYSLLDDIESGDDSRVQPALRTLQDSITASADLFAVKPFFLSDDYSILDATLAPLLMRFKHYGVRLPESASAVSDYANKIFSRSAFQVSLSDAERDMI